MPLKYRKRIVLAKIEVSYGVDPTPTGAANAILVHDLQFQPLIAETINRDLVRPSLGNDLSIHVGNHIGVTFDVEIAGAGAAGTAPAYGPLLRACGLNETITPTTKVEYAPVSTGEKSLTIYFHLDGQRHKLTGARGTFGFTLGANQIPRLRFSFLGLWNAPASVTDPTPDFTAFKVPLPVNNGNTPTFNLHAADYVMYSFEFNQANQVSHLDLVNDESVLIVDRKPAGSCVIEAPTIGTKDWFTTAKGSTTGALTITHGVSAGAIFEFTADVVQVLNPSYGDSDGRATVSMGLSFVPTVGDDDFLITIK